MKYIVLLSICLVSCSKHIDKSDNSDGNSVSQIEKHYVIQGDPKNIVKGADLNPNVPFRSNDLGRYGDFLSSTFISFDELSEEDHDGDSQEESENHNKPRSGNLYVDTIEYLKALIYYREPTQYIQKVGPFYLIEDNDKFSRWFLSYQGNPTMNGFVFIQNKSDANKNLKFEYALSDNQKQDIELLHFSEKYDGTAFSLLFYDTSTPNNRQLFSIVYTKRLESNQNISGSKEFNYIYGPGVKMRWFGSKVINVCGNTSLLDGVDLKTNVQKGINDWNKALKGSFRMDYRYLEHYPPFSDLNTSCVYYTDSYFETGAGAITFTMSNFFGKSFIDSDILIFDRDKRAYIERNKENLDLSDLNKKMQITVTHELGHLLGLDHQFEKPSVMGYTWDFVEPTDYDNKAIQELYSN